MPNKKIAGQSKQKCDKGKRRIKEANINAHAFEGNLDSASGADGFEENSFECGVCDFTSSKRDEFQVVA